MHGLNKVKNEAMRLTSFSYISLPFLSILKIDEDIGY